LDLENRKTVDNSKYSTTIIIRASRLKQILWYFISVIFFENTLFPFSNLKVRLLRIFGAKMGRGALIKPNVKIKFPWKLMVGDYSWIGEQVWIDNHDYIEIGDNVCISQGAMIVCGNHDYSNVRFNYFSKRIGIESGAWLGARSIVCPGVTVGSHAVLAVGSVATSDLLPFSIYQGNPAVKIRDRIIK